MAVRVSNPASSLLKMSSKLSFLLKNATALNKRPVLPPIPEGASADPYLKKRFEDLVLSFLSRVLVQVFKGTEHIAIFRYLAKVCFLGEKELNEILEKYQSIVVKSQKKADEVVSQLFQPFFHDRMDPFHIMDFAKMQVDTPFQKVLQFLCLECILFHSKGGEFYDLDYQVVKLLCKKEVEEQRLSKEQHRLFLKVAIPLNKTMKVI